MVFTRKKSMVSRCNQALVKNLKTQIVTKLKNPNCDNTQNLKFLQNSKTQIVTKLKNSNCDKTKKVVIVTSFRKNNWTP